MKLLSLAAGCTALGLVPATAAQLGTYCNPIDLPYRFQPGEPVRREAADPCVVFYKGEWWLFASKCGGYWHTRDFSSWAFVAPTGLPIEAYAPTASVIGGRLYFCANGTALYVTDDPAAGEWEWAAALPQVLDPDLFADDDGRVFLYYGCSNAAPIRGVELDPKQEFKVIRGPVDLIASEPAAHGWEVKRESGAGTPEGDRSDPALAPWIEGAWMTKEGGRYFLQYASPATELSTYGDGVYAGGGPLGPFTYQPSNPFSFRPSGFATGAGHGATFRDAKGNWWHVATITISRRHVFERRLGLFPARFFPDGQLACDTYLGDYPQYFPGVAADPFMANSPGWMLLSLRKPVVASSELPGFPAPQAVDESIRTWWSAATREPGEWLQVDLGAAATIRAVQVNFAGEGATSAQSGGACNYLLEVSDDGRTWHPLVDRREDRRDAPHDYVQLAEPVAGRYVRLTGFHNAAGAYLSVSGLRVFGNAPGPPPAQAGGISARRDAADARRMHVAWTAAKGAEFYIVRYGVRPDRLFSNCQVYGATVLDIASLNAGVSYYATVDAINSSGITRGPEALLVK